MAEPVWRFNFYCGFELQFQKLRADFVGVEVQNGHAAFQVEAGLAGIAWVEKENPFIQALVRFVGVAEDDYLRLSFKEVMLQ